MTLAVTASCASAWAGLWYVPEFRGNAVTGVLAILVAAGFAVAAVVVAEQPGRRVAGVVLAAASVLWPLNSFGGWDVGPMPLVRQLAECVFWVLLPIAVLLYQHPRFGVREWLFTGWVTIEFVGGQLLWVAVSRPEWSGLPASTWWPSLTPDLALFEVTRHVLAALYVPCAALLGLIVWLRVRRVAPVDRYSVAPVVAGIAVAGTAAATSWSIYERTTVGVAATLLLLPVAFIYAATCLSRLRVRLGDALDSPPPATGPRAAVTAALGSVLRDPNLSVTFWSAERGEWIGETGQTSVPWSSGDQVEIPVLRSDGRLSAVVSTRATSLAARREVEAVVRLAGTVIENAGLRAVVQAQAEAVGRAHARTVQAGIEERRRLERDLHDGAQQRLLGVLTLLAVAQAEPTHGGRETTVAHAEKEIRCALAELRDLAHGLHPSVLSREGLPEALTDLAERMGLPVDLTVRVVRLDPALEISIYYVISEALTNIRKHAAAERAWVRVVPADVGIDVEVRDDGVGGADPRGHGLRGLADRVIALGGRFTLYSPVGAGTSVRAWIPCE